MLSTRHVTADPDAKNKLPEMVEFYNKTKGGVDLMDQLCHKYSVSRRTKRWPMAFFFGLMNIVGVNSYVLMKMATNKNIKRRLFLKKLAIDLITPQMEERFTWPSLPTNLQVLLGGILQKKRSTNPCSLGKKKMCRMSKG
ncbi:transposase [Danaus plexippus plexippus]|uniref:Transposase n=1 Tax=Danaus plexippus plexippus TaxID=278856 RepID=A0A212FNH7_DANPL|nr:transposase [Danaus plexippus plexippus]